MFELPMGALVSKGSNGFWRRGIRDNNGSDSIPKSGIGPDRPAHTYNVLNAITLKDDLFRLAEVFASAETC
jgi:hypothetical protein